jgi:hypothetical protein
MDALSDLLRVTHLKDGIFLEAVFTHLGIYLPS